MTNKYFPATIDPHAVSCQNVKMLSKEESVLRNTFLDHNMDKPTGFSVS